MDSRTPHQFNYGALGSVCAMKRGVRRTPRSAKKPLPVRSGYMDDVFIARTSHQSKHNTRTGAATTAMRNAFPSAQIAARLVCTMPVLSKARTSWTIDDRKNPFPKRKHSFLCTAHRRQCFSDLLKAAAPNHHHIHQTLCESTSAKVIVLIDGLIVAWSWSSSAYRSRCRFCVQCIKSP
jgi:hypothetical protein